MAKKPVKKKKQRGTAEELEILQGRAEAEVEKLVELAEIRGKVAQKAYDAQDKRTRKVIDAIVDRLLLGANGLIRVAPQGSKGEPYAVSISMESLKHNALFIATELMKDFALFDFKVENYVFPDVFCAGCGTKLVKKGQQKKAKAPLKKKRRKKA